MNLLILGASVRAAAFSALRAGCLPLAVDLFNDRDLTSIARSERVPLERYPDALFETGLVQEADAWCYTGALENRPRLIDDLAGRSPLLGISGPNLMAVRDPFHVHEVVQREGFSTPSLRRDAQALETDGRWLQKPYSSGGGRGIAPWNGQELSDSAYYQERVEGKSLSAVYLGRGQEADLLGVTEQAAGLPRAPFGYRGSLGPWPVSQVASRKIGELGELLARRFQLRGLFGVDFILLDDDPILIEINPRYTASVEVLELAFRRSLIREHLAAFSGIAKPERFHSDRYVAKEVVFAEQPGLFEANIEWCRIDFNSFEVPRLADIPEDGTPFERGDPVITVFGEGKTIDACRADLERNRVDALSFLKSR